MNQPSTGRRVAAAATALLLSGSVLLAPSPAQAAKKAKPLKGNLSKTVTMGCDIFGTEFDYDATIKLTGKRATKKAKAVKLTAKMSDMPGKAPLALDYDVRGELSLKVGSAATTLIGSGRMTVDAHEPTTIPTLKGSAKAKGQKLAVTVQSFDLVVLNDDGSELTTIPCTPSGNGKMGKLKLK